MFNYNRLYFDGFQRVVRSHLVRLVGENFLSTDMVTQDQARTFAVAWNIDGGQTCGPCCTVHDFKVDLIGPPQGEWNQSAGRVFCRDFLNFHRLPDDATEAVLGAFFTRIKTLKAKYKKSLLQESQRRDIERQERRYRRKYLVCLSPYNTV